MKNAAQRFVIAAGILGSIFFLSAANADSAPVNNDAWKLKVQKALGAYVDADQNVGVSFAAIRNGETYFANFGSTSLNSNQKPKSDTVFQIGSVTKTFTSVVLAELVNQGAVKLDDPVSKFFPEVPELQNLAAGAITLKQLSTHTSGLPRLPANFNSADPNNPYADYTTSLLVEALKDPNLLSAPGPYPIQYSNMGAGLLGYILTRVTNLSYEQMIQKFITGPLQMQDTGVNLNADQIARSAQGYDEAYFEVPFWNFADNLVGAGGIHSTITDMFQYLSANLNPDLNTDLGRAIQFSHQLQVQGSAQNVDVSRSSNIGLGWILNDVSGDQIVWHNGEVGGFNSYTGMNPSKGIAIELMSNTANTDIQNCALYLLLDRDCAPIPQEFQIQDAELQKMTGKFVFPDLPGLQIQIVKHARFLAIKIGDDTTARLHAISANQFSFSLNGSNDTVTFQADANGDIQQLVLIDNGSSDTANRVP